MSYQPTSYPQQAGYENTSGQGPNAVVPTEIQKLNWGAFLLSWIWGIGNGVYIALLALLPFINIFVAIYLLIKGNELAWRGKQWASVDAFLATQKKWTTAGLIVLGIGLVCACISIILQVAVLGSSNR